MGTPETILVTGATGTTGSRLVAELQALGHPVRGVGRSTSTPFDWGEPATHAPALDGVRAAYLLPPVGVADPERAMVAFVDLALARGVQRLVLLSASVIEPGSPGLGRVDAHLREHAPEWAVLRPSWFMQNFERGHYMAEDIARSATLRTSVGDGRIAFVDAADIASVAARLLTDPRPQQAELVITGPRALSYDDVASILSRASGRRIVHERVTRDDVARRIAASGADPAFAGFLAELEALLERGAEDRVTDAVARVAGRPARSLETWAHETAHAWRRADPLVARPAEVPA